MTCCIPEVQKTLSMEVNMGMITPDWYIMRPFRLWANAVTYLSAGYHACVLNMLSPMTGDKLSYDVHR